MNDVKIYGKNIFKIIAIINKLQLKGYLGDIYAKYTEVEKKDRIVKVKLIKELDKKKLENNSGNIVTVLNENTALAKELADVQKEQADIMQDVIFTILEKISYAETEIFELLADVYNKDVKVIAEEIEIDELVKMIEGIVKSDGFVKVFTKFFK